MCGSALQGWVVLFWFKKSEEMAKHKSWHGADRKTNSSPKNVSK